VRGCSGMAVVGVRGGNEDIVSCARVAEGAQDGTHPSLDDVERSADGRRDGTLRACRGSARAVEERGWGRSRTAMKDEAKYRPSPSRKKPVDISMPLNVS